jgi:hypothetical protein
MVKYVRVDHSLQTFLMKMCHLISEICYTFHSSCNPQLPTVGYTYIMFIANYLSQKLPETLPLPSVADPDPGSGAFLAPGSGIRDGKKIGSESGMNIPEHTSESYKQFFGLKYLNSLMRIRIRDPESGME